MYIVYDLRNDSKTLFFQYSIAEEALLKQGFQEVFPEQLSATEYRIYDNLQQTTDFEIGTDLVEFISLFRRGREFQAIYQEVD